MKKVMRLKSLDNLECHHWYEKSALHKPDTL